MKKEQSLYALIYQSLSFSVEEEVYRTTVLLVKKMCLLLFYLRGFPVAQILWHWLVDD